MPDVVNTFIETNNFSDVQKAQDKILFDYNDDIIKYAENVMLVEWRYDRNKLRSCIGI